MTTRNEILRRLADGRFHSGTALGAALGITRAAVCKNIRALAAGGLEVHRVSGRGYRLATPLRPLERAQLLRQLGAEGNALRSRLTLLEETDSTNRVLLERARAGEEVAGAVCLAEAQRSGRGRRGRSWVATPYHNLLLSFAWRFDRGPAIASGLSLAAGVAVLQALEDYGVRGAGLKWPNDVLWQERKLAGLLIEMQGESAGPCLVVIGVGINGYIDGRDAARIDQPWVDLQTITGALTDRNRLAALLILRLAAMARRFADAGFAPFRADWERRHVFAGRRVRALEGEGGVTGVIEGIDEDGALRLRDAHGRVRRVLSGEISLRIA